MLGKIPPHSEDSELFVIGACMIEKEAVEKAVEMLRQEDFYEERFGLIFKAILDLVAGSSAVDISSISVKLKERSQMPDPIKGEDLVKATDIVSSAANVDFHITVIKENSIRRQMIRAMAEVMKNCFDLNTVLTEVQEAAEKRWSAIMLSGKSGGLEDMKDIVLEAQDILENAFQKKSVAFGILTGFDDLDHILGGLQKGNMVTLAARPGMGKTSLAFDIVRYVAIKERRPAAIFSFEMTRLEILYRLISAITKINLFKLRTGGYSGDDFGRISKALEMIAESNLMVDATSGSFPAIRSAGRRAVAKLRRDGKVLALIVIDYLQLISSSVSKNESRQTQVAEISRGIKSLALELNVPILALSQLNRQTEQTGREGRPRLSDLRESGAIEQDSDVVLFIYRPATYQVGSSPLEQSETKLIIAKNRNGRCGEVPLYFCREITSFIASQRQQDP